MLVFALFLIFLILYSEFDLLHSGPWDRPQELFLEYLEYAFVSLLFRYYLCFNLLLVFKEFSVPFVEVSELFCHKDVKIHIHHWATVKHKAFESNMLL